MSFTPHTDSSSPPGHQDLVDSLAAPAQVDQVGGTTEFVIWVISQVLFLVLKLVLLVSGLAIYFYFWARVLRSLGAA
jgi:hypothetical protein